MIETEEIIYQVEQCKAQALEYLWESQAEQLSALKSFWIENGSISSELKNYLKKAVYNQKNAYREFVEMQTELLKRANKSMQTIEIKIKRFEVCLKEVSLKKGEILFEKGTVLVSGAKNEYYNSIEKYFIQNGYRVQWIPFMDSDNDTKELFEKLPDDVVGFVLMLDKDSKYQDFKHLYFCMKHFSKKISNFFTKRKFVLGISFQDGRFGLSGKYEEVTQGSLSGLLKSLHKEWKDNIIVKMLDLSPYLSLNECRIILDEELSTVDDYVEISRSEDGKRYTLALEERYDKEDARIQPSKEDVFVVSGGGKGITAACIIELCKKYSCKFIILGRSKLEYEETEELAAARTKDDLIKILARQAAEAKISYKPSEIMHRASTILGEREIRHTIQKVEAAGGKVMYCTCDILDEKSVKKAIDSAVKELGTVTGFIHGAGVIRDKKIDMKTEEDFRLVYGTKCLGAQNILNAINEEKLQYIFFFSSVAGYFGNEGQTDYGSANEYLNKLSFYLKRKYPEQMIMSMNWGAWDGGMVSESLRKNVEKRGRCLISMDEGIKYFMDQFTKKHNEGVCQAVIYDSDR